MDKSNKLQFLGTKWIREGWPFQMGLRNIIVEGKECLPEDLRKIREKSLGLSRRDVEALLTVTPNLRRGAGKKTIKAYQVLSGDRKVDSRVMAIDAAYFSMGNLQPVDGVFFDHQDEAVYNQVCVLGASVKQGLFGFESALGKTLKINNTWFSVVGVIADQTLSKDEFQGVKLQNTNNDIYIPLSTALRKLEAKALESELDGILLEVESELRIQSTALVVSQLLEKLHNGESDFSLIVPEQLFRQSQQTQKIFNIVMGCIAGISLLVGGIGIMNIMLANVLERTHEIGIRRAVGARRMDIRLQFLIEAVTISSIGGIIGVGLGFVIAGLVVYYAGWSTIITTWSIVLAFGVSATVGVLFGSYPAIQASRLSPIEVLRYE
jgi:putative ABC transport system permease protein